MRATGRRFLQLVLLAAGAMFLPMRQLPRGLDGRRSLEVSDDENAVLALTRAGMSNNVGRRRLQACATYKSEGFKGYHLQGDDPTSTGPACVVDDMSGSDAALWLGYSKDGVREVPAPLDPRTGRPHSRLRGKFHRPAATAVLEVRNGAVFQCNSGGTVFNATLAMRLSRWYHKLPPPAKPEDIKLQHVDQPLVSLCIPFGDRFRHQALDMIPKLSILLPFLERHPEAQLLHGSAATPLLKYLRIRNTVEAEPRTVYTAPAVYTVNFQGKDPVIGFAPFGANALLQDSRLFPVMLGGRVAAERSVSSTILYLSRSGEERRGVKNEADLLAAIRSRLAPGVQLEVFRNTSLAKDLAMFRTARVVIGSHGRLMANIAFMPPGGHVIEFIPMRRILKRNPRKIQRACYFFLARACRLAHWMVQPKRLSFDDHQEKMTVPIGKVLSALSLIGVVGELHTSNNSSRWLRPIQMPFSSI